MESWIESIFRFTMYVFCGFSMEIIFAVKGIELCVGVPIPRRVPGKYLEGFVSLYMIPIHGFGMLFGFEALHFLIQNWAWPFRYLIWAVTITSAEALGGYIYLKLTGFYSWDYYRLSPYKIFRSGLTLWPLLPLWGVVGLGLEVYSTLLRHLSPHVSQFFLQAW
ncbi:MAG: hypothetical protein HYV97_09375 [Bdellovibrio sp.]|nr:hypothetical protein [Bdellovibrio sp.]